MFLPGESQGWGELGGLPSVGSHRVRHDWSDLAAAAAVLRPNMVNGIIIDFSNVYAHHKQLTEITDNWGLFI